MDVNRGIILKSYKSMVQPHSEYRLQFWLPTSNKRGIAEIKNSQEWANKIVKDHFKCEERMKDLLV